MLWIPVIRRVSVSAMSLKQPERPNRIETIRTFTSNDEAVIAVMFGWKTIPDSIATPYKTRIPGQCSTLVYASDEHQHSIAAWED